MHSRKKVIRIAVKAVTRLWRTRAWCWSCCFIIYQYCSLGLLVVIVACLFYEHVFIDAMIGNWMARRSGDWNEI